MRVYSAADWLRIQACVLSVVGSAAALGSHACTHFRDAGNPPGSLLECMDGCENVHVC
jgi:hypothetical protein